MSKKFKYKSATLILCLLLLILFLLYAMQRGLFKPSIVLIGEKEVTIEINSEYEEQGAKGFDRFRKVDHLIEIENPLDTSQPGEYTIIYKLKNQQKKRQVIVQDTIPPYIQLIGEKIIYTFENDEFVDAGAEVNDNSKMDVKLEVSNHIDMTMQGEYEIVYTATDLSGNSSRMSRRIIVNEDPTSLKLHYQYDGIDNTKIEWWFHKAKNHERQKAVIDEQIMQEYHSFHLGIDEKVIYLTFDEGGNEITYIKEITEILNQHQIPATYFLTRNYILKEADFMKELVDKGHDIGNHTRNHYEMPDLANEKEVDRFVLEISETEKAIWQTSGQKPPKIFRFPKGTASLRAMKMVSDLGYRNYFWSHAYYDYAQDLSKEEVYNTLMMHLHNGAIYLLHPSNRGNYEAMEDFIVDATKLGYRFDLVSNIN